MKNGKKKLTGIQKFAGIMAIIVLICMILLIPPVSDKVAMIAGTTSDKVKGAAQTVAGITLGIMLVSWGIASLSVPVIGAVLIIAGLGLLAWNVWPLFSKPMIPGKG